MHTTSNLLAFAATISQVLAAYQGFNYGSTFTNGAAKSSSDFEAEFKAAQSLAGTNGAFSSARLYTMIQAGTANTPISALDAAVSTKTSLLLGLWASAGDAAFSNELAALKSAIDKYGNSLSSLIAGISVGSEDLYRITPTGIANKENPGVGPDVLVKYIKEVKSLLSGSPWSQVRVGHVDTWTAWVNGSNAAAVEACDWVGVDAYPYFQTTMANGIDNGPGLLDDALAATQGAVGGKEVWVTETGWPISGPNAGQAVASKENAETFWQKAGCPRFGKTNVWWYTLQDAAPDTPSPTFGILADLNGPPAYKLTCDASNNTSSASSSATASDSKSTTASGSKSAVASSSDTTAIPTLGGGSPGSGIGSSQLSLELSSATGITIPSSAVQTGSSGASTPQPGSGAGAGSGSGSSSGNATTTASGKPSASATVAPNAAPVKSGSICAAFAALMVAIVAL